MKLEVSKEHFRRLRKVLKSKLNGGNLVQEVNIWVVSLLRYSAAFLLVGESVICMLKIGKLGSCLQYMKDSTQSLVLKDCIYLVKMIAIEHCVELAVRGLDVYVHGSEERLIQAARRDKLDGLEAVSVLKKTKKEKRLQDWEDKALHGQFETN